MLRREEGLVLRRLLDFEVEDQRKKWRPKRTRKKQVEAGSVKVGLRREDVLCQPMWCFRVNQVSAVLRLI